MATITKKLQLHWSTACCDSDDPWELFCTDMSKYGYVRVGNVDVTFDVPDNFDPREPQIAMLEQKKEQLTNEFHAEVTRIETEISKLKAIEYTGPDMCLLPEQEQFAAMDDMADWGVKHLKESPCPAVIEVESANKAETAPSEVTQ